MKNSLALYIHWPWCKHKCPYCDFNSHVTSQIPEKDYVNALKADLQYQHKLTGSRVLTSIFFGGGTPSLMSPHTVEELLNYAHKLYEFSPNIEISIEVNPTSGEAKKLAEFTAAGVNRISIGVQALDSATLQFLGREHNATEALYTVEKALGLVDNINIDLIYGIPTQSIAMWSSQLKMTTEIGVHHISAYQLTIEPNSAFYGEVTKNKWAELDSDAQGEFFDVTKEILTSQNYKNYEISNFAVTEKACLHNIHVWKYKDYIGIGAGAHGRFYSISGNHLATNTFKIPKKYMKAALAGGNCFALTHETTKEQRSSEKLILGLRLANGIKINAETLSFIDKQGLENMLHNNMLAWADGYLHLTAKGWYFLDGVLNKIIA